MDFGDETYYVSNTCDISNRFKYAQEVFSNVRTYAVLEVYKGSGCENLDETLALVATGRCQVGDSAGTTSFIANLDSENSFSIAYYRNVSCDGDITHGGTATSVNVSRHDCIAPGYRVYSSDDLNAESASASASNSTSASSGSASASNSSDVITVATTTKSSGIGSGTIVGIVVAVVVVLLVVLGFVWYRKKNRNTLEGNDYAKVTSPTSDPKTDELDEADFAASKGPQSLASLWDDEDIATARIPREKVEVQHLISRGGYGEVYYGLYFGSPVAIKMLLPQLRKSIKHVNDFLDEVKLLQRLDHPRVVQFVGIAWDTLSDLCFALEYMEGGDLRALLVSYEEQNLPVGFDRSKVTIALHVAHALTYLHSLDLPILHRDLKSKNILLSSELEAKVTDFGISREREEKTMTAGVGTSLWMAPEVMLGQRYDDKADVFSLGVVLSELDLHVLPYSHAKDLSNSGRKLPDTAVLQMVALGKIHVEFSSEGLQSMVELGRSCVALDPKDRPSAAEVLYKLQLILRQEL
ncbi:Serine/threonine-protein kinase STY17 [Phytophthora citrophthora]|uniref:Serine/threonine-protein kinase STY17 n=1 Tax=Phytophthora citrophthora TaxID=4793 RepID=A0AAD9LAW3_9STRA|nr:Serine/threonine-protein kinase STY17 [Phytophthora citrophthora]